MCPFDCKQDSFELFCCSRRINAVSPDRRMLVVGTSPNQLNKITFGLDHIDSVNLWSRRRYFFKIFIYGESYMGFANDLGFFNFLPEVLRRGQSCLENMTQKKIRLHSYLHGNQSKNVNK